MRGKEAQTELSTPRASQECDAENVVGAIADAFSRAVPVRCDAAYVTVSK